MRQSHLTGVLSARNVEASVTPIVPAQRAPFASTHPTEHLFTRWIEAYPAQLRRNRSLGTNGKVHISGLALPLVTLYRSRKGMSVAGRWRPRRLGMPQEEFSCVPRF